MSVEHGPQLPPVRLEDGSLDAEVLSSNYGVSPEFARRQLSYRDRNGQMHTGEVADMFDPNTGCPAAWAVAETLQEDGPEAVVDYFASAQKMRMVKFEDGFELTRETVLSPTIIQREAEDDAVKKNSQEIFPTPPMS